jgi:pantothenate kinase-related protein Tda10
MEYSIAKSFSKYPAGRYESDGDFSGERLRKIIDSKLRESEPLIVDIIGTEGFGSSFLEEAFGGLIRSGEWTLEDLKSKLQIKSDESTKIYEKLIWNYLKEEAGRCRDS